MNILFLSSLSTTLSAGPVWSVAARILAQEKYDNVMWINTSNADHLHWKSIKSYHNISEFKSLSLNSFPIPFNRPDIVVFEGFYSGKPEYIISKECRKYNIPYIIVPRSSLTWNAMHNKSRIKKEIAHFFFCDSFVKHSAGIQYLTEKEYADSKYRFDHPHLILSNGIFPKDSLKKEFSKDSIKAIYIGRIDIYHKGLDILLNACKVLYDDLLKVNFKLVLYGPKLEDYFLVEKMINDLELSNIVSLGGEILGENKKNAILESDIFILTSRFEGHPMGLIEALSYGLPCLVTMGTNIGEEVKKYNCGFVSDISTEGVIESLKNMIHKLNNLEEMSSNAILLANEYDWDSLANRFHDYLTQLIN